MRRVPKSLSVVAKATVPRARPTASNPFSTMPLPEKEEEEEVELEFLPFPDHIPGGLVVEKKKTKTETSSGKSRDKSSEGTNVSGKQDFGGGCSGCPGCGYGNATGGGGGCSGCPGCRRCGCPRCSGGCDLCFGCDGCKYEE